MANVEFTISPAPGIINDMIAVLYDGAAEITRLPIPAPHTSPQNLNFTNVVPKTYIVKIHETPGAGVLGTLRHDFWVDASLQKLKAYDVVTFQVGLGRGTPYYDPADQDTDYINPDIDGLTYTVFKPGYGPLDWAADITPRTGGGFTFTNGQKFAQDEIYTLLISNLIAQPITQSATGFPDGVVDITADTAFGSVHYNKMLAVDPHQEVLNITINLSSVPDGTKFCINTHRHNGVLINVALILSGGACIVNGRAETSVFVGKAEEVTLFKTGSEIKILNWDGDHRRIGEKIYSDGTPPTIPNILPFTGFWLEKIRVPRLWYWYVNRLAPDQVFSGTDDITPTGNNIRKWGIGSAKIWIPNYQAMTFKINNGGFLDNDYQPDSLGPGDIKTTAYTGATVGHNFLVNDGIGFAATHGDGGEVSTDHAFGTNRNTARTSTWPVISPTGENNIRSVWVRSYVII
jgi:hypothetical protein